MRTAKHKSNSLNSSNFILHPSSFILSSREWWTCSFFVHSWVIGWFSFFLPYITDTAKQETFSALTLLLQLFDNWRDWYPELSNNYPGQIFYAILSPGFFILFPIFVVIIYPLFALETWNKTLPKWAMIGLVVLLITLYGHSFAALLFSFNEQNPYASIGAAVFPWLIIPIWKLIIRKIALWQGLIFLILILCLTLVFPGWIAFGSMVLLILWIVGTTLYANKDKPIKSLLLMPDKHSINPYSLQSFRWWIGWSLGPLSLYFINLLWVNGNLVAGPIIALIGLGFALIGYIMGRVRKG